MRLEVLREEYRRDLFDDFLPFMDRHVVDHELGGFLCNADRNGTRLSTEKDSWYEGRGIWVYSFLYSRFTHDPKHLEIARKAVEFILGIRPPGDDPRWPRKFTREGRTLVADGEIYGALFIAEGLAEYARAAGEPKYRDIAKGIVLDCIRTYDQPDYPVDTRAYLGEGAPPFPGARPLGVSMLLVRLATQMLAACADGDLERVADRALEAIIKRHHNPAFHLMNELLNHDLSFPENEYANLVATGHAIETLWMVMDEALRRSDRELFDRAAGRFRRHLEVAWDDVYGGVFHCARDIERNEWFLDKVLWAQEEALIGCLMLVEHAGDDWAREWFDRIFRYVQDRYPLSRYHLPLWITAADRKVTFVPHYHRIENYHHPRHLMLNLLAIERMIKV